MQFNKSRNQTYNTLILVKKLKIIYLGQAIERVPQIEKFFLNNKKSSYSQRQDQPIVLGHY